MTKNGKTYFGFGFGPIQNALFLYEAFRSKNFSRFVVSEVDQKMVDAIRRNHGQYVVNIARRDRIDQSVVDGVELYNPQVEADRKILLEALAVSDEMATALPSVKIFNLGSPSVVDLLAAGLDQRKHDFPTILYAAENHNHAAEILGDLLKEKLPAGKLKNFQILNTVIGKMSGVITDPAEIERLNLKTVTPDLPRAILVEEFNRILVSQVTLPNYTRGIDVFIEKPDLLPFEEAKLYGHNAIHALIAYLADSKGLNTIADAGKDNEIMAIARKAFIDESGAALIKKYASLGDSLFTPKGYEAYADDLLQRMTNPNLNDLISRVGRDHVRKLGFEDRIYGTMHLALQYGVEPKNMAMGAAAGVLSMIKRQAEFAQPVAHLPKSVSDLTKDSLETLLMGLWTGKADKFAKTMIDLTWQGLAKLR
jgi:mannitol-1-phosphate 5-dehydrogenase